MLLLFVGTEAVGAVRAVTQMNGDGSNDKKKKKICAVRVLFCYCGLEASNRPERLPVTQRHIESPTVQLSSQLCAACM